MTNALIIFIKNPKKGEVKTRLGNTIGEEKALAIYLELLNYTCQIVLNIEGVERRLYYSRFIDETDNWAATSFSKYVQKGDDLGERMENAFETAFADGMQKVVIIGSDCGDLQKEHIQEAFDALDKHDFVIGPAEDGGYYLLGMRSFFPYVFRNKKWSTKSLLPATLKEIADKRHNLHLLSQLSDVDYEEDYLKWKNKK